MFLSWTFSKSYISVSGFSVEDIHLRCKGILGVNALAVALGRAGAIRAAVVYRTTLERRVHEADVRAIALDIVLFNDILVVVKMK